MIQNYNLESNLIQCACFQVTRTVRGIYCKFEISEEANSSEFPGDVFMVWRVNDPLHVYQDSPKMKGLVAHRNLGVIDESAFSRLISAN